MGAMKGTETSIEKQDNKRGKQPNLTGQELHAFFLQLPHKVKQCLESRFKKAINDNDRTRPAINIWNANESSTSLEANLQRQMQAWKLNPSWTDQLPKIKVSVPKGSLCNLNVEVNVGLPPDAVYNIVTDPDNKRVFKNIKEVISRKVLVDEGLRQVVELEQAALWRFLWWSGIISVHVLVDQNRKDHSMKFTQLKAGFMKRFEGCWRVEPLFVDERWCHPFKPKTLADYVSCTNGKGRIGSRVSLEQLIQPAIVPPPPISWYLRGITAKTTEMLINDLLAEAARIRGILGPENSKGELGVSENQQNEYQDDELHDIKKRWALRRRHARRSLPSVRSDAN